MGKLSAALIILFTIAWLGPMCASLPGDLMHVAPPAPPASSAVEAAPSVSTAAFLAPVSAGVVAAPAPAAERPPLTVSTYRSRRMFPLENGKYVVSVLRANKADVPAVGVKMTLTALVKGAPVESAASGPGQTLAAGTTSYFGLHVSTGVFDTLLDAPEDEAGSALKWSVSYRYEDDAPGVKRCYGLMALPRRRDPEGLAWKALGESLVCGK